MPRLTHCTAHPQETQGKGAEATTDRKAAMILIGLALTVFAIVTRMLPSRLTNAINHRPFSSPYHAAPGARDPR
ncbi:MAG: hypothetical protein ACR2ND_00350 [Solirubrobacteraceae bacterium]